MAALLILNYDVHDDTALAEYRARAADVLLAGSARLVTSTDKTHHLGETAVRGGTHTVVLWFASTVEAVSRYELQDYEPLIGDRLRATTPHAAFIVDIHEPEGRGHQ